MEYAIVSAHILPTYIGIIIGETRPYSSKRGEVRENLSALVNIDLKERDIILLPDHMEASKILDLLVQHS